MREIYDITVFEKVDAMQQFVELNNVLTNNLSKRLVELGEYSSYASSFESDFKSVVNSIVQKHKAIIRNSLFSVKCLAKYLNQYVDKVNYLGYNNELYKAINYTRDIEALSVLTYCLRTKNYDFSNYVKDEFIVEIKDKFTMSTELENVIVLLPDDFDGILTIRYQVENNYPLDRF